MDESTIATQGCILLLRALSISPRKITSSAIGPISPTHTICISIELEEIISEFSLNISCQLSGKGIRLRIMFTVNIAVMPRQTIKGSSLELKGYTCTLSAKDIYEPLRL
jgi:hypothetical protein